MSVIYDWITPCQNYALRLTAESWQQINLECSRAGAIETGGILVGHYTNNASTALVTEALPPPKDSTSDRNWFHRGLTGLRELLSKRWENQVRTYYVGEWHYHPASIVVPSGDDLAQMYSINSDPKYNCREPVMLIIGMARHGEERPVRAFLFPQGEPFIEFLESADTLVG